MFFFGHQKIYKNPEIDLTNLAYIVLIDNNGIIHLCYCYQSVFNHYTSFLISLLVKSNFRCGSAQILVMFVTKFFFYYNWL
jgi:hypothetical protein